MSTDLEKSQPKAPAVITEGPLGQLWWLGCRYAKSALVPEQFRGHPEDCFIVTQLADRMGVDAFMLFQNTYVVHGRPGFEAKLQIALLNESGKIHGVLRYQFVGTPGQDSYGCRAYAVDAATRETIEGPVVDWRMVKAEGWDKDKQDRRGNTIRSKWNTMPEQMFRYRAASFFVKAHYPEVVMGTQTREELEDAEPADFRTLEGEVTKSDRIAAELEARESTSPHQAAEDAAAEAAASHPEPEAIGPTEDDIIAEFEQAIADCDGINKVNEIVVQAEQRLSGTTMLDHIQLAAQAKRLEIRSRRGK